MTIKIPENLKTELKSFDILDGQKIKIGDSTKILAERWGQKIEIFHIPTSTTIVFKAFLDGYSDQFQCDWQSEDVYGRMDPIATFQNTTRSISVSFDVIAPNRSQGKENLENCNKLAKFLYPGMYTQSGNSSGGKGGPSKPQIQGEQ